MSDEHKPDGPACRIIGAFLILALVLPSLVACGWVLVMTW